MSHDELFAEYERLKALAERLQAENITLQEQMKAQKEEYEQRLAEAQAQIEELRKQLFGPNTERLTPEQEEQLKQLNQDLQDEAQRPAPVSDQILQDEDLASRRRRKRQQRNRRPLPDHLETETVTIEPELKLCPCCGKPLQKIGEEVSEEIDLIPAKLIRRRTVRPKYACPCGEAGVNIAPMPPRLIPQSRLGLGLGVHIVLSRFDDHLSYYRLEQQFEERHGILIPRQQMVQWVEPIAELLKPVYNKMWLNMFASGYMQVDETPVRVMDPDVKGKAARGYLWFYSVPGGDVVLDFNRSRGLLPVQQRLKGFVGTIQTDAYEVYQSLERKESQIERIGCLAHARRRFYAALKENLPDSVWFINQIRLLYKIEDNVRELDASERYAFRQNNAPSIWQALKEKTEELKPKFLPKSTMGKAISYFIDEYKALTGYLQNS
jgi:transposase